MSLVAEKDFKPHFRMSQIEHGGFVSKQEVDSKEPVAIVKLEGEHGDSFWLVCNNFYVITRYNRSPLYAMAVYQLSEAIRRGMGK
jgi:membrane-bound lytic murein transglycosylase B